MKEGCANRQGSKLKTTRRGEGAGERKGLFFIFKDASRCAFLYAPCNEDLVERSSDNNRVSNLCMCLPLSYPRSVPLEKNPQGNPPEIGFITPKNARASAHG